MAFNLRNRHLLTLKHHTPQEIEYLLDLSRDLKNKKRDGIKGKLLAGKNVALIFEKPSTRTRCAFTVATIDEGGHPEYLGTNDIQLGHKEDVKDTARVLGRMFDGIEFRGYSQQTVEDLAKYSGVPVWNGLTDDYHPTQILADLLTVREKLGRLKGVKFVFCGDGRNNMANSLMIGCAKMGLHFVVAAPTSLHTDPEIVKECYQILEDTQSGGTIEITDDVQKAVKDADVIYTDVWASMGEEDKLAERKKILQPYQVNMELLKATGNPNVLFLHCLPAVKGYEVTEEVFESHHSKVFDQAENRMPTIKATIVSSIGNL
ncbi:ornithine carbamoyltransferase [Synergistaceae bacterium OttesenSCG-928-D05]|nr:ornithine carbamoyltransferase [Synergistaceae bacterium OttesenSCG-928-D05]